MNKKAKLFDYHEIIKSKNRLIDVINIKREKGIILLWGKPYLFNLNWNGSYSLIYRYSSAIVRGEREFKAVK